MMIRAVKLERPWDVACAEKEMPVPKKGETLIRVRSARIRSSDTGTYRGTNPLVSYPRVTRHGIAGEIISISEDNRGQLKPDDHVIVGPYLYCGHCYPYSIGGINCCTGLKVLEVHAEGGMAEYFVHPGNMLVRLPDDMPWDLVPIVEPLTIVLHGIHRGGLEAREYTVAIGTGPIRMLVAMTVSAYGVELIMIDLVEERLLQIEQLGVRYTIDLEEENTEEKVREYAGGNMTYLVVECFGASAAVRSIPDLVCNAGRITLTGWSKNETPLPTDVITKEEVDIRGARISANEFKEAIRLVRSGQVDARQILARTVSLDEAADTIRDIEKNLGNYTKVSVMIQLDLQVPPPVGRPDERVVTFSHPRQY